MRNIIYKTLAIFTSILPLNLVYGQSSHIKINNPLEIDSVEALMVVILDAVVKIGTIIAIFFIIYTGYLFVVAQGNPEKIKTARASLLFVLIGAMVLIGAHVIGDVICNTAVELGAKESVCE